MEEEWGSIVRGPYRRQQASAYCERSGSFSSSTDPSLNKYWLSLEDDEAAEGNVNDKNSSSGGCPGDKTPTPISTNASSTNLDISNSSRSRSPFLKTPSLVDELLSEIYARFGDGLSSQNADSSRRASASGSQVKHYSNVRGGGKLRSNFPTERE
jgi:hypothetical protein